MVKGEGLPLFEYTPPAARFNGSDYKSAFDFSRLRGQQLEIWSLMQDGRWRTLSEIEAVTGFAQASISAQLRHFRKPRFGAHTLEKQPRGDRKNGLFEYRLLPNTESMARGH